MMSEERMVDPQQIPLLVYCRNNPLAYIDPTGQTIDFETDAEGRLTKKGEYAKKMFEEYKEFLQKDPKKYKSELATVGKLEASEISYKINVTNSEITGSHETEGRTTTDGKSVLITIRNIGNNHEAYSLEGRFRMSLNMVGSLTTGNSVS